MQRDRGLSWGCVVCVCLHVAAKVSDVLGGELSASILPSYDVAIK